MKEIRFEKFWMVEGINTAPISPYAPVMTTLLLFCEFKALEGKSSLYGSRCIVFVSWKGYWLASIYCAIFSLSSTRSWENCAIARSRRGLLRWICFLDVVRDY